MRAMTQRVFVDDIEAEEDAVTGTIDCCQHFFVHFSTRLTLFPSSFVLSRRKNTAKKYSDCIFVYCIQFYVSMVLDKAGTRGGGWWSLGILIHVNLDV